MKAKSLDYADRPGCYMALKQIRKNEQEVQTILNIKLPHNVRVARVAGATWKEIGEALGISEAAAKQRYTGT